MNVPVVKLPSLQFEKTRPETAPAVTFNDCVAETSTGMFVPFPDVVALIEPESIAVPVHVVPLCRTQATGADTPRVPVATIRTVASVKVVVADPEVGPVATTR